MEIAVKIPESQAESYLTFCLAEQQRLETQIAELEKARNQNLFTIENLRKSMEKLTDPTLKPFGKVSEYEKSWSWVNKVEFAIKKLGKPVGAKDLFRFLEQYERLDERKKASLYPTLSSLVDAGKLWRQKKGSFFEYGEKAWFSKN